MEKTDDGVTGGFSDWETEEKEVLEQIQYDAPFSFFILSLRSDCPNLNLSNNDRK